MRSRRFCEALARAKGEQWRLTPSSRGFVNLDVSVHPRRTNGRAVDSWWFSEGDILLLLRYPQSRWLKVSCFRTGHKHGRSGSTPTLPMGQAQPRSSQSTKWGSSRGFYRKPRSGVEQTHIGIWHSEAVRRRWLGMAVHVSRIFPYQQGDPFATDGLPSCAEYLLTVCSSMHLTAIPSCIPPRI